jgi:hypothetical protein
MKKIITLVLALALVLTSVAAFAETHATPSFKSFATMTTKTVNGTKGVGGYIEITLSKPVDRLLVKWAEKGAEPEELAVDEDLKAYALLWGHKYMPGTTQYYDRSVKWSDFHPTTPPAEEVELPVGNLTNYIVVTSEKATTPEGQEYVVIKQAVDHSVSDAVAPVASLNVTDEFVKEFVTGKDIFKVNAKGEFVTDLNGNPIVDNNKWEQLVKNYKVAHLGENEEFDELQFVKPHKVVIGTKTVVDIFGNAHKENVYLKDDLGRDAYEGGYLQGFNFDELENPEYVAEEPVQPTTPPTPKISTVIATPAQTAYMTVQGEWAVYYNRAGKIVGIEYFDGQF